MKRFGAVSTLSALVGCLAVGGLLVGVAEAGDTTPPTVNLVLPAGGSLQAGIINSVIWSASDNVGVNLVQIDYKTIEDGVWTPIARNLGNDPPVFSWYTHNTPSTQAWVRVTAFDAAGNSAADSNDVAFEIIAQAGTVASTLRDFKMPGSAAHVLDEVDDYSACSICHGGYDDDAEPGHAWLGTMMGHAVRDPLFMASLAIAEQDAPSSGDFCLRCHAPGAWFAGRCNPTDGELLTNRDQESVSCAICHGLVDPVYVEGQSPAEDLDILNALEAVPVTYANGQMVIDPEPRRRGPRDDGNPAHDWLQSDFFMSSDFCGTCHDVSNPMYDRVSGADYELGPLDAPAASQASTDILPLERTYSEWKASDFAIGDGVFSPEFAGNKPDGFVSTCQDCHMADVIGKGAIIGGERSDLAFHDMMGGSVWLSKTMGTLYPAAVDVDALNDASTRAEGMLRLAALLDLELADQDTVWAATVTVTNRTGHKLPTGFPEGRRMWIHLVAEDNLGNTIYESGAYDFGTAILTLDEDVRVYEGKMGISHSLAAQLDREPGPTFHFALNDTFYKENRIPPQGFTNASFDAFGGKPVDSDPNAPVPRYADGQNWDTATYLLPPETFVVRATLYYQSLTKEHVDFLQNENVTNGAGTFLSNAWATNGKAPPFPMVADTAHTAPTSVDLPDNEDKTGDAVLAFFPETNPFRGAVDLRLDLAKPQPASWAVFDATGRRLQDRDLGLLGAGPHRLHWDGNDRRGEATGAGVYWFRIQVGDQQLVKQVVRID